MKGILGFRERAMVRLAVPILLCFATGQPALSALLDLDTTFGNQGKVVIPFNVGTGLQDEGMAVAIQPDGKIVVAGSALVEDDDWDFAIARLHPDGTLDGTFGSSGRVVVAFDLAASGFDAVRDVALQADGKIVVAGIVAVSPTANDCGVVRLLPDGALDTTFDGDGSTVISFDLGGDLDDHCTTVGIAPDQKIYVGGAASWARPDYDFALARLDSDGSLDATFDGDGKATFAFDIGPSLHDFANDLVVQPDGSVVLVGEVDGGDSVTDFGLLRVLADGSLDPVFGFVTVPFDVNDGVVDVANGVTLDGMGRIVAVGTVESSTSTNPGSTSVGLVRLLADGTLDSSFDGDGKLVLTRAGEASDEGNAIAADGRSSVVVGGTFDFNGTADVEPDFGGYTIGGSALKTSGWIRGFDIGGAVEDYAYGLALQADGKIVQVGMVQINSIDRDMGVIRYIGPKIFSDGFESGDVTSWSGRAP